MKIIKQIHIALLVLCGLVSSNLFAGSKAPRPNIIFILTDDLGYADVGFNGAIDIITPNLDELADNGAVFTSAYAAHPFCGPSRAGLLTGRYPHKFGAQFNLPTVVRSGGLGLPLNETFISTVLQDAGYFTGAVGKWHLGETYEQHPNRRGFDEFYGFLGGGHMYFPKQYQAMEAKLKKQGGTNIWSYITPLEHNGKNTKETEYITDVLSREAVNFINKAKKKRDPFFLYLAYNAPHTPLEAKDEDMAMFPDIKDENRKIYAGMVYAVDRGVKKIVDALKKNKQLDNTVIVFMSDNGGRPDRGANNFPLKEGKGSVHEGGYRSPMLIHWPKAISAGTRYSHPITSLDFYPTFAALAGAKIPEHKKVDGVDFWSDFIVGDSPRKGKSIFSMRHEYGYSNVAARKDQWKVVRKNNGIWQLYDVDKDPAEANNLAKAFPVVLRNLVGELEVWSWQHVQPLWFHKHWEGVQWREKAMPRFHETFEIDLNNFSDME